MDSENKDNKNIKNSSANVTAEFKKSINSKSSDKFDLSILGKIDLVEAEKIASEEVIFLTEEDLIEGLEDFELVPIRNYKNDSQNTISVKQDSSTLIADKESDLKSNIDFIIQNEEDDKVDNTQTSESDIIDSSDDLFDILETSFEDSLSEGIKEQVDANESIIELQDEVIIVEDNTDIVTKSDLIDKLVEKEPEDSAETIEELSTPKHLFKVKINEETLDSQLASILNFEGFKKSDDKVIEKYSNKISDSKCRFADDQFLIKHIEDDSISYNEDPLTERLVKMIDVADGKIELLDLTAKDGEYLNYILEDYTLYNSEKFDNVFKEEVFYVDSDFEFIDNAIIRDDFTRYIHEIDDYFESEDSLIQSEISEILGLVPEENEYIEDKLFGDYYKKFDVDNEIDFIKPEIDFFRSNYTGLKNLNYFSENKDSLLESEKTSLEEDISSPNAIVFEENISEIAEILRKDYNFDFDLDEIENIDFENDDITRSKEITNITDKIIILEDKEKLIKLVSEFPEKHENLIKLLSYLDGLFEKLPEEAIRKFADSEYFELYSKVLREMGV